MYNFASAGYCTFSRKDHILDTNQTLAVLLGVKREELIHNTFLYFFDRDDHDTYYLYRQRAFEDRKHQVSNIRMAKQTGEKIDVRLESVIDHQDETGLQVMLSDITEQRRMEKEAVPFEQTRRTDNQRSTTCWGSERIC